MKVVHVLYSGLGGHSNVFFAMVTADKQQEFTYEAIFNGIEDVRQDYIDGCNINSIKWHFVKKTPGKHFSFLWKIAREIRKTEADIIFLHGSVNILAGWAAKLFSGKRKKIIIRETQANHLKTTKEWIALKIGLILSNTVVFLSSEYADDVKKKVGWLWPASRTTVIPNGLDLLTYTPKKKVVSSPLLIGMQSRLVDSKDHISLLKAIAILKNEASNVLPICLEIAGDGEYRKELEKIARSLEIQDVIAFKGMLNEADLVNFLQSLDIYVHASLGETMSTAIMQAMACRLPIIASDVPGINNMIKDKENGLLVAPKDPVALATAIKQLVNNTTQRNQLALAAYEYSNNNFSNTLMLERYKKIFNK